MRRDLRAALPAWVVARLVVLGALVIAAAVRTVADPNLPVVGPQQRRGLLAWDASWYLDIARSGYEALPTEGLRFFPAYPLLARLVAPIVGSQTMALLVIASASALAYGALVHRLVRDDLGDPDLARRSAIAIALAPIGFVLTMGYTEALAGVAGVVAFGAARRQRWWVAAMAAAAAGALRPTGLLLVLPLAIEAAPWFAKADTAERARRAVAVAAPVLGTLPYLAWVQIRYGDGLAPFAIQGSPDLRGPLANPLTAVARALAGFDGSNVVLGLRGLWAIGLVGLVIVAARRLPSSYAAYGAVSVAVALTSTNLGSLERYAFGAFPLVIAAASLVPAGRRPQAVVFGASALAMGGYAVLTFLDLYVP